MNQYVTGAEIRRLRENKKLTQEELAAILHVSSKAVSKWETGKGFPDISLLEPLAKALDISVIELLAGAKVHNRNRSADMRKGKFYICPICGNVIHASGEALVSCCGITLVPAEAEEPDAAHGICIEIVEDEYYVHVGHPMEKTHHLLFLAAVSDDRLQLVRLYPEGTAAARFKLCRIKELYACCNQHGLFRLRL